MSREDHYLICHRVANNQGQLCDLGRQFSASVQAAQQPVSRRQREEMQLTSVISTLLYNCLVYISLHEYLYLTPPSALRIQSHIFPSVSKTLTLQQAADHLISLCSTLPSLCRMKSRFTETERKPSRKHELGNLMVSLRLGRQSWLLIPAPKAISLLYPINSLEKLV